MPTSGGRDAGLTLQAPHLADGGNIQRHAHDAGHQSAQVHRRDAGVAAANISVKVVPWPRPDTEGSK
jgi:hypothetical protein